MKHTRKGFTTVELVIVIAVIAILATVLIPTFSNLIAKAQVSAAVQECKGCLEVMLHDNLGELKGGTYYFIYDKAPEDTSDAVWCVYQDGTLVQTSSPSLDGKTVKYWAVGEETVILKPSKSTEKAMSDLSPHVEVLCIVSE